MCSRQPSPKAAGLAELPFLGFRDSCRASTSSGTCSHTTYQLYPSSTTRATNSTITHPGSASATVYILYTSSSASSDQDLPATKVSVPVGLGLYYQHQPPPLLSQHHSPVLRPLTPKGDPCIGSVHPESQLRQPLQGRPTKPGLRSCAVLCGAERYKDVRLVSESRCTWSGLAV